MSLSKLEINVVLVTHLFQGHSHQQMMAVMVSELRNSETMLQELHSNSG